MRFRKWNVNCTGRLLIASKPVDSIFKVNIKLYRWIVRFDWMLSGAWVDSRKHKTEMPINSVFLNKSQHVLCNTGPKRMVWTIFGLRAHFCIFFRRHNWRHLRAPSDERLEMFNRRKCSLLYIGRATVNVMFEGEHRLINTNSMCNVHCYGWAPIYHTATNNSIFNNRN